MPNITLPESYSVRIDGEAIEFDIAALSAEMVMQLALHGLKQKLIDSGSQITKFVRNDEGVNVPNPEYSHEAKVGVAMKTWDSLVAGEWTMRGEAQEPVEKVMMQLARAKAGKDATEAYCQQLIDAKPEAYRSAAKHVLELRERRRKEKAELAKLLD